MQRRRSIKVEAIADGRIPLILWLSLVTVPVHGTPHVHMDVLVAILSGHMDRHGSAARTVHTYRHIA